MDTRARRFRAKRIELKSGSDGYVSGETLRVLADCSIADHNHPGAILADWISTTRTRGSDREIFQMQWNPGEDVVIYDLDDGSLWWRARTTTGGSTTSMSIQKSWRNIALDQVASSEFRTTPTEHGQRSAG